MNKSRKKLEKIQPQIDSEYLAGIEWPVRRPGWYSGVVVLFGAVLAVLIFLLFDQIFAINRTAQLERDLRQISILSKVPSRSGQTKISSELNLFRVNDLTQLPELVSPFSLNGFELPYSAGFIYIQATNIGGRWLGFMANKFHVAIILRDGENLGYIKKVSTLGIQVRSQGILSPNYRYIRLDVPAAQWDVFARWLQRQILKA